MKNNKEIDEKVDKISDDIVDIKVSMARIDETLASQNKSLEHHIKRSDALEDQVGLLKEYVDKKNGSKELMIFIAKVGSFAVGLLAFLKALK